MADQIQEVEETTTRDGVPVQTTRRVTTSDTASDERAVAATRAGDSTVERIIYFLVGLVAVILAARFVLSLLGANRSNGFANLIYGISYPFVAPFFGLFGYEVEYGRSRFEVETLVAIAVYAVIGYGLVKLIRIARKAD
jgi:YggT family protein